MAARYYIEEKRERERILLISPKYPKQKLKLLKHLLWLLSLNYILYPLLHLHTISENLSLQTLNPIVLFASTRFLLLHHLQRSTPSRGIREINGYTRTNLSRLFYAQFLLILIRRGKMTLLCRYQSCRSYFRC